MHNGDSFFSQLVAENEPVHRASLRHPVVQGIGDGTLPEHVFRYYVEQDYGFLLRYVRVIAQAIIASDDLPTTTRLAELLHGTLAVEMDALGELYGAFGGDPADLPATRPAPTCQAYTDHLLATAARGDLLVTLAAILPCQWGYREIGRTLAAQGLPVEPRYGRWISEYASDEYGALVDWLIGCFDELAARAGVESRERARTAFALSASYELAFWEMAGQRQVWPEPNGVELLASVPT